MYIQLRTLDGRVAQYCVTDDPTRGLMRMVLCLGGAGEILEENDADKILIVKKNHITIAVDDRMFGIKKYQSVEGRNQKVVFSSCWDKFAHIDFESVDESVVVITTHSQQLLRGGAIENVRCYIGLAADGVGLVWTSRDNAIPFRLTTYDVEKTFIPQSVASPDQLRTQSRQLSRAATLPVTRSRQATLVSRADSKLQESKRLSRQAASIERSAPATPETVAVTRALTQQSALRSAEAAADLRESAAIAKSAGLPSRKMERAAEIAESASRSAKVMTPQAAEQSAALAQSARVEAIEGVAAASSPRVDAAEQRMRSRVQSRSAASRTLSPALKERTQQAETKLRESMRLSTEAQDLDQQDAPTEVVNSVLQRSARASREAAEELRQSARIAAREGVEAGALEEAADLASAAAAESQRALASSTQKMYSVTRS